MKRKILFLSGLFISVLANVFASTPAERYVLSEEKRYIKYCKKENKKGKEKVNSVNAKNAFESVMLFECFKKEADYLKTSNPRGMEVQINNLLDSKISFYNESINNINEKFDLNLRNVGGSVEEVIIEKQIYIKREDDERITEEILVEQKITTLEEAVKACRNRGFRQQSSDPLESYLFDQCITEFGFTPSDKTYSSATNVKIEKNKKAEVKKQQDKKSITTDVATKKKERSASTLPATKEATNHSKNKKAEVKKQQDKKSITTDVATKKKDPASPTMPAVKETGNDNKGYVEGRVFCKVDVYGTKICRYEPTVKKNQGSLINNLYLD